MISEKTREWVNGADVEPDPTNSRVGNSDVFLQNSRCKCGKRFVTDGAMRVHSLNCSESIEFQQNDGTWR